MWLVFALGSSVFAALTLYYYKALQMEEVSKVVPIDKLSVVFTMILAALLLHEQFTLKSVTGCILIGIGTLLMVM